MVISLIEELSVISQDLVSGKVIVLIERRSRND
jgi:hypothetical protein